MPGVPRLVAYYDELAAARGTGAPDLWRSRLGWQAADLDADVAAWKATWRHYHRELVPGVTWRVKQVTL